MAEPQLTILDVGDGCCTVLRDEKGMVLFDYAGGPIPKDYFRAIKRSEIDAVFISHTHKDHCAGLTGHFGEDFPIEVIFMNQQRGKARSAIYRKVIRAIAAAQEGPNPPRLVEFTRDVREQCMARDPLSLKIIGPRATQAREDQTRSWQNEHTTCGVVRIDHGDRQCVLLPGDLNARGLEEIAATEPEALEAEVLLFPHHGGGSNGNSKAFAERLTELVKPTIVAFSQARRGRGHPHARVVAGVLSADPDVHICCTQLSEDCDKRELHEISPRSDITIPAAGLEAISGACCAGSIELAIGENGVHFLRRDTHLRFVDQEVDEAMCDLSSHAPSAR